MKRTNLLLLFTAGMLLASCGGQSGPAKDDILKEASGKTAIAIWADSGAPINRKLEKNKAEGAHAPIIANSFTFKYESKTYTVKIDWKISDADNWTRYKSDDEHDVVIAKRQSVGGQVLEATFTPTFTYEDATLTGDSYKFYCDPYEVNPQNKTLAELTQGAYVDGTISNGDVIRTKGVVTLHSPDFTNVFIEDNGRTVQLYKAGAFSTFYEVGKTLQVVGKYKDYYGPEFDPVYDVSPAEAVPAITPLALTKTFVDDFRTAWKAGDHSQGNRLTAGEFTVKEESKGKNKTETDRSKNTFDTLYLTTDDGAEIALYTKPGYAGDEACKKISTIFGGLKKGDKVKFKGALYCYNDLVEVNLYSDKDIEVTYVAPIEESSAESSEAAPVESAEKGSVEVKNHGTVSEPITVAEAKSIVADLADPDSGGVYDDEMLYVTGVVAKVTYDWKGVDKNMSFTIKDAGAADADALDAKYIYLADGMTEAPAAGDTVLLRGYACKYLSKGTIIPQISAPNGAGKDTRATVLSIQKAGGQQTSEEGSQPAESSEVAPADASAEKSA